MVTCSGDQGVTACGCGLMPGGEARVSLLSDNCVTCYNHIRKRHVCVLVLAVLSPQVPVGAVPSDYWVRLLSILHRLRLTKEVTRITVKNFSCHFLPVTVAGF